MRFLMLFSNYMRRVKMAMLVTWKIERRDFLLQNLCIPANTWTEHSPSSRSAFLPTPTVTQSSREPFTDSPTSQTAYSLRRNASTPQPDPKRPQNLERSRSTLSPNSPKPLDAGGAPYRPKRRPSWPNPTGSARDYPRSDHALPAREVQSRKTGSTDRISTPQRMHLAQKPSLGRQRRMFPPRSFSRKPAPAMSLAR